MQNGIFLPDKTAICGLASKFLLLEESPFVSFEGPLGRGMNHFSEVVLFLGFAIAKLLIFVFDGQCFICVSHPHLFVHGFYLFEEFGSIAKFLKCQKGILIDFS